jgi:hypothetical protein
LEWFNKTIQDTDFSALHQAVIEGDLEVIRREINTFLMNTISYNDYAEDFYHGVMVGILSGIKGYTVRSNRESGMGRPDLLVSAKSGETAFVFEFKYAKSRKVADLEEKCKEAILQIEERQYAHELEEEGYQAIMKYGIAFSGKGCRIMKAE